MLKLCWLKFLVLSKLFSLLKVVVSLRFNPLVDRSVKFPILVLRVSLEVED